MKMCIECPHRKEHELGEEIILFPPGEIHVCHMHGTQECVGHRLQQTKIALGLVQVEDYDLIRTRAVQTAYDKAYEKTYQQYHDAKYRSHHEVPR